jgi:pilus assembly protein CpaC
VRANAGKSIALFSALSVVLCAGGGLQAQAPAAQPAAAANQDASNELSVAVGKSILIDVAKPIARVAIGLPDTAEVTAISPNEVMLNGKAVGETSLIIWDTSGGRQFFDVTVRASSALSNERLDSVRRQIQMELPGQALKVSADKDNIFLRGTVKDLNASDRAVMIASAALPAAGTGKVVNLLNVNIPAGEPQILLKVRFEAVDRDKELQLGINLFGTGFGNVLSSLSTGQFSPPSVSLPTAGQAATAALSNPLNLFAFSPNLNLGATLEALETKGVTQSLAQPNILAANGKEASFLAGGEYPYPVAQASAGGGSAAITISFKEYGVRLNFIPTITPRGTIRLQVAPEVSALDFADAVEISGFEIPAITTRKVNTEVELAEGQSFAIGGLLYDTDSETYQKIPFLGDIPIIGKFFQSMSKDRKNTELIVIVTPVLVEPIPAGQAPPEVKFPTKFLPPNSGVAMHQPDEKPAGYTAPPVPASMPVERLVDSMKPEKPLMIEGAGTTFGTGSSQSAQQSGAGATSAPPAH